MTFYETLSRYYDDIFPSSPDQQRFVEQFLPQRGRILDVAAGTGNLAAALAQAGFQVTALDVDESMVQRIREKQEAGEAPRFETLLMDMRGLDGLPAEAYHAVLCVGNSLVHLKDLTEIADSVIQMYDRLVPGGTLILQNVNYDRILRDRVKELPVIERSLEGGMLRFRRFYELEEDGILFQGRLELERDGASEVFENSVRLLPMQSEELLHIAEQYGLPRPEFYGGFKQEPYQTGSTALVAVFRKPE